MANHTALYFNGLGGGRDRYKEQVIFQHLERRGVKVEPTHINWFNGEPFDKLFDRMTGKVQESLQRCGRVAVVGASAGGSMALNVFGRLREEDIVAASVCGCVREAQDLPAWDYRTLNFRAYHGNRQLDGFYDSVKYCEDVTIPSLEPADLQRLRVVKPLADFVVPRSTMSITGVEEAIVPVIGHNLGIAAGLWRLPEYLG